MNRTAFLTIAGIAVGSLAAYAIYFDYKRRTDADFRRKLRKDQKRAERAKSQATSEASQTLPGTNDTEELRNALEQVRSEDIPKTPEEKERYFMTQVSMGEQLSTQGPAYHLAAAMYFYRGLRVYPSPVELIMIYQKTVPEPVFKLVMEMTNLDVSSPSSPSDSRPVTTVQSDVSSPPRSGAPSEASSQEWDKVTDPGRHSPVA